MSRMTPAEFREHATMTYERLERRFHRHRDPDAAWSAGRRLLNALMRDYSRHTQVEWTRRVGIARDVMVFATYAKFRMIR